ncbi:MAG: hypothetical protein AAFY98_06450 [Verrucomicrobiota bacterium]
MDKQTSLLILALGIISTSFGVAAQRDINRRKATAVRKGLVPHYNNGCFLVKIVEGPSWAVGEYATYDAESKQLHIDGEPYDSESFQFILA